MRAVAAIPAVGLLAGAGVGLLRPDSFLTSIAVLFGCAAVALGAWRSARPWLFAAAVGGAFFAGGVGLAADAWREAWRPSLRLVFESLAREQRAQAAQTGRALPENDGASAVVTGVLRADAAARASGVSLSLAVTSIRSSEGTAGLSGPPRRGADDAIAVSGGVLLTVSGTRAPDYLHEWRAGRTVRMPAQLRRPSRYLNPGVADEERSLARRGTTLVGSVKSGALVEVVAAGSWLSESAWAARSAARRAIVAAIGRWSPRSAAIVTAIVIGDRAGLDDDLERTLQEAGTYHVIAISGGNIAILTGLTLVAFRMAGVLGRAAMLTAIVGLLAYCYVVGGGASVNRATLMAVIYLAARTVDLRGPPLNALALVAAVLVAIDPLAVADPAFLLTCGATLAILAIAPALLPARLTRRWLPAVAILAASIAAEAMLMPIGAYLFSRVTVAGLVLNFAAIPLMAIAQIAGMAVVPASAVSPALAASAGWLAHVGAEGLVRSGGLVSVAPVLAWRVPPPHWTVLVVYYGSLATICACGMRRTAAAREVKVRRAAAAAGTLSALWMLFPPSFALAARGDGRLHVTFVDVGQGDATLVRLPRGSTLLVDAGGLPGLSSYDIGDRVVGAVLRDRRVRRLDIAAFTHGDADHIGGAMAIVNDFRPRDVWEGIPVPRAAPLVALRAAAAAIGARWTNVQANDLVALDGVRIAVRHPPPADWERQRVRNDDSIVLELMWRDVSIVLAGDIGREVEAAIAPLFPPAGIRIIKAPHHGSLTSSSRAFLQALGPRAAVFSAGRSNTFGHPAPAVLDRYRQIGAEIFRTDQDGAVLLTTDGYSVDLEAYTGRRLRIR